MKKSIVFVLSLVCIASFACTLPDVKDINLSGCDEQCNTDSKACFANVDEAGTTCLDQDAGADASYNEQEAMRQACGEAQTKAGEDCVNALVSCIDVCIKQTEDLLKK